MENLIKNNKEKFIAELPAGHQERFAMKLQSRTATKHIDMSLQKRKHLWFGISSVAAAVLLILILINVSSI